jgi:hypothetical protein
MSGLASVPWYPDIEWLLAGSASDLGERSAGLEPRYGSADPSQYMPYSDHQLGFGPRHHGRGAVARWRRCYAAWRRIDPSSRRVLVAHYCGAVVSSSGGGIARARFPQGTESRMGQLTGVALLVAYDCGALGDLLSACQKGKGPAIGSAISAARRAVDAAHAAWDQARREEAERWLGT